MRVLAQMVLPFRVEATDETLTANAGLVLFGEFVHGLGFKRWLQQEMPKPGSGRIDEATAYVTPLVLMLNGGGRSLEDMRTLKSDSALSTLLKLSVLRAQMLWATGCAARVLAKGWQVFPASIGGSLPHGFVNLVSLPIPWTVMLHKSSLRRKQLVLPTRESKGICR